MKILMLLLLLSFSSCITAQDNNSSVSNNQQEPFQNQDVIDVSFCELIKNPEKFEKKVIRVKAIYGYGFEWSNLYSSKCSTEKVILVETDKKKCENAGQIDEMDFAGMGGRVVGVVAVGIFTKEEKHFGAIGKSDYVFRVKCFEKAKMLSRLPQSLKPEQLTKIEEEFENSSDSKSSAN